MNFSRSISFTKMHGTGNDFVVLNNFDDTFPHDFDFPAFANQACAPHFGIGADGLLSLEKPDENARQNGAHIRMRMWNPDGSEDMCGNGLRCIARLAHESGAVSSRNFVAQTLAGLRACEILPDEIARAGISNSDVSAQNISTQSLPKRNPANSENSTQNAVFSPESRAHEVSQNGNSRDEIQSNGDFSKIEVTQKGEIRVAMGEPNFDFAAIPFAPAESVQSNIEYSIPLGETVLPHATTLSTGSAHTVIFVDELPDDETFARLSGKIENHAWFPERTSIMWARVLDFENVQIRIWERGVANAQNPSGETLACGTGACATAVAAQMTKRCGEKVRIHSRGGVLEINWKNGEQIQMTGAAKIVYEGIWS